MIRFFVYEEYGAKYESMVREMAATSKHIPNWHAYERGIEALANSLISSSSHQGTNRKGLTFEDLLIKVCVRMLDHQEDMIDQSSVSPYNESASILYSLQISTNILLSLIAPSHAQKLRRCYAGSGRRRRRSTGPPMIKKHE